MMRTPSPLRSTLTRGRAHAALATASVGLLAVTLAGCGSDDGGADDTADDTAAPSASATPSESETIESAPAPTITETVPTSPPSIEPSGGIGGEPTGKVGDEERQILADFAALALGPSPEKAASLPFADDVRLGLGPKLLEDVDADDAGEADEWEIDDVQSWRGRVPPFSALTEINRWVTAQRATDDPDSVLTFGAGRHRHCVSPAQPQPKAVRGMRHLWIQPAKAPSCIDWFTVDLYLTQGRINAVTTDMYEP